MMVGSITYYSHIILSKSPSGHIVIAFEFLVHVPLELSSPFYCQDWLAFIRSYQDSRCYFILIIGIMIANNNFK